MLSSAKMTRLLDRHFTMPARSDSYTPAELHDSNCEQTAITPVVLRSFIDEKVYAQLTTARIQSAFCSFNHTMICITSRCCTGPLCHACTPGPSTPCPAVPSPRRALHRRAVLSLGAALLAPSRLPQPCRADGLAEQPVEDVEVRHKRGTIASALAHPWLRSSLFLE